MNWSVTIDGFTADLKAAGLRDCTVYNKFELLMTFLKANKVPRLVTAKDWPRYTEQEVEIYEAEELAKFFKHCNQEQKVLFRFFLGSAGREQEVAFTAWPNLDLKNGLWHMWEARAWVQTKRLRRADGTAA